MFKTKATAEQAALNGTGREWDSQACREFQSEVLSSSPRESQNETSIASVLQPRPKKNEQLLPSEWGSQEPDQNILDGAQNESRPQIAEEDQDDYQQTLELPPNRTILRPIEHVGSAHTQLDEDRQGEKKTVIKERDSAGRLRYFYQRDGVLVPVLPASLPSTAKMEDGDHEMTAELNATQKSSMSLTQENPESAYERFRSVAPRSEPESNHKTPAKDSTTSESVRTYDENDTGHVNFDLQVLHADGGGVTGEMAVQEDTEDEDEAEPEEEEEASQDLISQDPIHSLSSPRVAPPFDPQTPAPPINPFKRKGSVMKPHELFGATQPSSIGRFQSPTSSRPSPDVFNNYSSPQAVSSPLLTRGAGVDPNNDLSSPVKSAEPGNRPHQPRAYRSMKESQQRITDLKNEQQDSDSGSDSDLSNSTVETSVKRRKIDQVIRQNLSAVSLRQPKESPHIRFSSSFPSTKPASVEIPSTSARRRSIEEDYIAQCSGHDARDTQQEDMVADSQVLPPQDTTVDIMESPHGHPEPDNSNDAMVPETSPPSDRDRIRPMGEIASFSYSAEEAVNLDEIGGFTQDEDFEKALSGLGSTRKAQSPFDSKPIVIPPVAQSFGNYEPTNPASPLAPSTMDKEVEADVEADMDSTQDTTTSDHEDAASVSGDGVITISPPESSDSDKHSASNLNEGAEPKDIPEQAPPEQELPAEENKQIIHEASSKTITKSPPVELPSVNTDVVTDLEQTSVTNEPVRIELKAPPASLPKSQSLLRLPAGTQTHSPVSSTLSSLASLDTNDELSPVPSILKDELAMSTADETESTPLPSKRKRKVAASSVRKKLNVAANKKRKLVSDTSTPATRNSTRLRESSDNPLASEDPTMPLSAKAKPKSKLKNGTTSLFGGMAFAVSYVATGPSKEKMTKLIIEHGGQIFEDGFDSLFSENDNEGVELLSSARDTGFTALIADTHSRKVKYIQALALGLPCISGVWISTCVAKNELVDWSPYLLCAGHSSLLNSCRSRILKPYSAAEATLTAAFEARDKLLDGKSILLITGKGKQAETRKAYLFIARVLGPSHVGQVVDLAGARKKLAESEKNGETWDLIYVDKNEEEAASSLFGTFSVAITAGSRRRKSRASETPDVASDAKRVRVISDEVVIQSLIFGQLLDE